MYLREIIDALNGNARRRAKTRVAVGTSIGVLLGAAAGILLAPKSGKEIRKDIKHGAEWSVEKAGDAARKAVKLVKKEAASVNETVTEKVNDLKAHIRHVKNAPKDDSEILEDANEPKM